VHEDDRVLLAALRARDETAFARLVARLHPRLVAIARRILASNEEAEDAAQETWRRVVHGLDAFEGRSRFDTWVFQILINRARTARGVVALRREERLAVHADRDPLDGKFNAFMRWREDPRHGWHDPEHGVVTKELHRLVHEALDALPELQRLVLQLRDVEGRDSAETCATLGITEANQRVLLHRGRLRLREVLEREVRASRHLM
jgi:RNA polymerase sigma-70 factor (ECF subfamily)